MCLKLRNMKKQVHDFQRELLIFKNRDVQHERFAAAYLRDIPCGNQNQPYIWLLTEYAQVIISVVVFYFVSFSFSKKKTI